MALLVIRFASASPAIHDGEGTEDAVQKALSDLSIQAQAGRERDGRFKLGAGELGWGLGNRHWQVGRCVMLAGVGR
jgi:hypothetical protein